MSGEKKDRAVTAQEVLLAGKVGQDVQILPGESADCKAEEFPSCPFRIQKVAIDLHGGSLAKDQEEEPVNFDLHGYHEAIRQTQMSEDENPKRRGESNSHLPAFRANPRKREEIRLQIKEMLEYNVIKPSTSAWASPFSRRELGDGLPTSQQHHQTGSLPNR